ncbi:xanthine dehydrogenase accessory protein XdhC [Marinobacterium zhoushanense]|uniref:Xanthine dehydrogenase accessory protein XdhC n=1 Tax=Marinobacterium zhoushanense TaxID=1679163 RepID=A0ABQ1JXG0_9GAMM|nr:xanthine dehydrogenase accessory protein XdhC [Marinobacterium zhoushanense]GGB81266.1 xanthine dehydrogenase accessory protein XdhC [Marinobacterium zhoushanense]
MNSEWIKALSQLEADATPAVMITVVDERGSTPRNAGAKMVVSAAERFDTIGGGHLEHKAIKIARAMLEEKQEQPRLERFSLGASLGQCCGGATTLLFEPLNAGIVQIALFGAGHVARALVPILATLPCRIRWIDSREDEFPAHIPEGVEKVVNEFPVDEIESQAAGSYFIIMTHNHQLDQELTEAILKRNDFKYFGLIGSQTKRKKFEHRLKAKGFDDAQLERMTCPMGIPEVKGKLPAEIAVSVAGEVIARYNAAFGSKASAPKDTPFEVPAVERLAI